MRRPPTPQLIYASSDLPGADYVAVVDTATGKTIPKVIEADAVEGWVVHLVHEPDGGWAHSMRKVRSARAIRIALSPDMPESTRERFMAWQSRIARWRRLAK